MEKAISDQLSAANCGSVLKRLACTLDAGHAGMHANGNIAWAQQKKAEGCELTADSSPEAR